MLLLHWNINGLKSHYEELQLLVNEKHPNIVCIQETKLHYFANFRFKGYNVYRKDHFQNQACGGVVIQTANSLDAKLLQINTTLQAVAITLEVPHKLTVCCLYIPPAPFVLSRTEVEELFQQLPRPFLLVGDFNAHHNSWGSTSCSPRGNMLTRVFDNLNVNILNDGSNTYLCPRTNNWSAIDLSICSPVLAPSLLWEVLPDLYGSDHAPIAVSFTNLNHPRNGNPKWIINKGDWKRFRDSLDTSNIPNDVNEATYKFTAAIISAAETSIPKTSGKQKRAHVPWWTDKCSEALRERRKALRRFSKRPTTENLIEYRKLRAAARLVFRRSKRESWLNYTDQIRRTTPSSTIWRKLRSVCGKPTPQTIVGLKVDNIMETDPQAIANSLSLSFAEVSKTTSYGQVFQRYKASQELMPVNYEANSRGPLNIPFSKEELLSSIRETSNSAPGPDDIHN